MSDQHAAEAVVAACREAGELILRLRAADPAVTSKPDGSPVSVADRAASALLARRLGGVLPGVPVVCEEGAQDPGGAARHWLVDPLDGTREFLRGSKHFTVNVALIEQGRAVLGAVHAPADGITWWGGRRFGAFRDRTPIAARPMHGMAPRVMLSPMQRDAAPDALLAALRARFPAAVLEYLPGALKFCRLAEGIADVYPRTLPSCGWDSAAGQALLEGAGGAVLDGTGQALTYGVSPGWRNGSFVAVADAGYAWGGVFGWTAGDQVPDRTAGSPPMNS